MAFRAKTKNKLLVEEYIQKIKAKYESNTYVTEYRKYLKEINELVSTLETMLDIDKLKAAFDVDFYKTDKYDNVSDLINNINSLVPDSFKKKPDTHYQKQYLIDLHN